MEIATQARAAAASQTALPLATRAPRLESVDLLRGLVMIFMALDHVRFFFNNLDFPPEDLAHTNLALFFTRWITHFCAPAFFLLAGTGAYLSAAKSGDFHRTSAFLWRRGLWLVVLELTVIGF